jgi:RHS repeat-associated protein
VTLRQVKIQEELPWPLGGDTVDYNLDGNVIGEWQVLTSPTYNWWGRSYIYLQGQLLARYGCSTTFFFHQDHLGSTRLVSAMDASIFASLDYLPFGEATSSSNSGCVPSHEFTGDERDPETSLDAPSASRMGLRDHTQFRQYTSQLARWISPDPAGLLVADPSNPQSWNRYAYVLNNPMNFIDPSGLGPQDCNNGVPVSPDGLNSCGDPCSMPSAACDGGGGGGIGPFGGGGGGGGGSGNPPQSGGGTNPPVPPPNNPGTTFPGAPTGMNVCISIPGAQICANTPYPSWFVNLVKNLSAAGLLTRVFLQGLGRNFVDEFKAGGCVNTFFNASFNALNPFSPSASTLGDPAAAIYSASRFNALLKYAASRPNYLGGQGLLYPLKSSVFRSILSDATTSSGAGFAISADASLLQGLIVEGYQLATGACR